ncbi:Clavaminate synthase-like protein [Teratosphaeria nubilosa]|uniref:Clavaminate synthase-like protein n=1 Tax=Teratosphaeria nubilosa TaxID=161662 RepID=A0A6G1L9X6_9PEZI|nr:Clavaminate synthase-like protein [Teratosphaeria nubilosa]
MPCTQDLAKLSTIKFSLLLDGEPTETRKLIAAAEEVGFFYLDLTDQGSSNMLYNLEVLTSIMKIWFARPEREKLNAPTTTKAHGYKPVGAHAGVGGKSDGWEALKIGRQELKGRWALADVVKEHVDRYDQFVAQCHFALTIILNRLSSGLDLQGDHSLQKHHRDDTPSKSSVFFLHYPPRDDAGAHMGQNMHTDMGTLTLLFAMQWGLQVLCRSDKSHKSPAAAEGEKLEWKFVQPKPGHAVINVGDTLRFLTGRRLQSALHRALPIQAEDRYAVTYFLRPSDDAEFLDSDGAKSTAMDWYLKKNETYEDSHDHQMSGSVLLGGLEEQAEIIKDRLEGCSGDPLLMVGRS